MSRERPDRLRHPARQAPARAARVRAADLRMSVRAGIVVTGTEVLSGTRRRPQRPLALRAAARARDRGGADRRRRRPAGRRARRARLPARLRPDRHERRPRPDRGRPHRRRGRRLRRAPDGARRGAGGADPRHPAAQSRALALLQRGGDARRQPQAGDRPRGRDDPRAGRHRARPGRAARGRRRAHRARAPRPARRAAADVGGRRPSTRAAGGARRARARSSSGCCGSTACRRPRSPGPCCAIEADGVALGRLEITTCLRRGEIEIATVFDPSAAPVTTRSCRRSARATATRSSPRTARRSTSRSRRCSTGGRSRSAESCTGGLMAGAADGPRGLERVRARRRGRVLRRGEGGVRRRPARADRAHGAVSPEVAAALADGACARFGAQLGIGITGIAGPGGGTPEKPVGTVCLSVADAGGARVDRTVLLPGDRAHGAGADDDRGDAHAAGSCSHRLVSVRLFVALDLPARRARRSPLPRRGGGSGRLAAVAAASFHVTLAFIGHRPGGRTWRGALAALRACALRRARRWRSAAPLLLARVLAVAVPDPAGALGEVQARVSAALARAGVYEPEARPFRPHVTVARLRKGRAAAAPVARRARAGRLRRRAGVLYRSRARARRRHYEPLCHARLSAEPHGSLRGWRSAGRVTAAMRRALVVLGGGAPRRRRRPRRPRTLARLRRGRRRALHARARAARPRRRRAGHGRRCASRACASLGRTRDPDVPVGRPGRSGRPRDDRRPVRASRAPAPLHVIGFDQRGTGASGPAALPRDRARRAAALHLRAGEALRRRLGARRAFYTTPDSVADMEAIRKARRRRRAHPVRHLLRHRARARLRARAPGGVERLILDSVVDPDDADPFGLAGLPRDGAHAAALCPDLPRLSADPGADLAALVARLRAAPLRGPGRPPAESAAAAPCGRRRSPT